MRFLTVLLTLFLTSFSGIAKAEILKFSCIYHEFSDKNGKHQFKQPIKFDLSWDTSTNQASQIYKHKTKRLRVINRQFTISFIETLDLGDVIVTSIAKQTGFSVHSRNIIGMASQSYGDCK